MAKTGVIEYFRQIRNEMKKVTVQETTVSTIFVFVMVFIASVFLYLSDQIIAYIVQLIMGLGLS